MFRSSSDRKTPSVSFFCLLAVILTACGSGSSDPHSAQSSQSSASDSSSVGTSSGSSSGDSSVTAGDSAAAQLAAKLGKPARLLVGLGGQNDSPSSNTVAIIEGEDLQIDIYDVYLGVGDWTQWNQPPCDFVCVVAQDADQLGAVPMYTQYQMANNGDGNLSGLTDSTFMTTYWSRVKLLFQDIATYGKPALVNLEPDFWGYTEQQAGTSGDPTQVAALVSLNPDCSDLGNNVQGVAACLLRMARKYAPNAYVGFPPSTWGGSSTQAVIAWMNKLGAQNADFIVEQTLDRDAGCYEAQAPDCQSRSGTGVYWDATNQTHPNFTDYFATVEQYHEGIGGLPVIFWQTPEGVPSDTPGGTPNHYRDNRAQYFLTHPSQLTAVGGLGVVFSAGDENQTTIATDGGQFETLHAAYMANPAPLP